MTYRSVDQPLTPFCVAASGLKAFLRDHADADLNVVLPRAVPVRRMALDLLRQLFIEVDNRDFDRQIHGQPSRWSAMATLVLEVCPEDRETFIDEILFRVADPADYVAIADQILTLASLDRLVDAIIDRLASGTAIERRNALALQPALFGSRGDPKLGFARHQRLARARVALSELTVLPSMVREALSEYPLPFDLLSARSS